MEYLDSRCDINRFTIHIKIIIVALYVDGEESGSIGPPLLNLADPREAGHERRSRARPEVDNQRH